MAISHARSGQVIDVRPLGDRLAGSVTTTLAKSGSLEVIRLVLREGKSIPYHQTQGEITVQCLEGAVEFQSQGQTKLLEQGEMLFLAAGELHALRAVRDASLLVTIVLEKSDKHHGN